MQTSSGGCLYIAKLWRSSLYRQALEVVFLWTGSRDRLSMEQFWRSFLYRRALEVVFSQTSWIQVVFIDKLDGGSLHRRAAWRQSSQTSCMEVVFIDELDGGRLFLDELVVVFCQTPWRSSFLDSQEDHFFRRSGEVLFFQTIWKGRLLRRGRRLLEELKQFLPLK